MTATRKSMRFLTVLALVFAMVMSIAAVPVSATVVNHNWDGSEVWENKFTINGYNITPVKTILKSGKLVVGAYFTPRRDLDGNASSDLEHYTIQVRTTGGKVLASTTVYEPGIGGNYAEVEIQVVAGQQIQVYMGAYCSHGNACRADVRYLHYIYN